MPVNIQARVTELQGVHAIRADIAFNTTNIASGLKFGRLPKNSVVIGVHVFVKTAFNAATTNVLTVGTTSANADEILAAATVTEGAAANALLQPVATFEPLTADTDLYVKYTQTGTAATTGAATITVLYAANVPAFTPTLTS